jgi:hypothetical protein
MFIPSRQVLDIAVPKVHNTSRSLKASLIISTTCCTYPGLYIQDVVC